MAESPTMELLFWLALRSVPLIGNVTFRRLVEHFGTPKKVLEADIEQLIRCRGISQSVALSIKNFDHRTSAERELMNLEKSSARVVTFLDSEYPGLLLEITDPPPFLYLKGSLQNDDPAIGIVGSRRGTHYGISSAARIASGLAEKGITVVSGMARGIDSAAHSAALNAGGRSIGVLGCGIDVVYPRENRQLFDEMAEKGALVSEFPIGTEPLPNNFPRRNRIISGLSRGVLVVEAAEKSGSLITARFALEQGRDVFAIPGQVTSRSSSGTNKLIKQGAKLVETVEDILEELPESRPSSRLPFQRHLMLDPLETKLSDLLSESPLQIDELATKAGLTVQELSVILLRLELQGSIIQLPGKIFANA